MFLLVRDTQDFNTVEDTSTSVDFWVVLLVSLRLCEISMW